MGNTYNIVDGKGENSVGELFISESGCKLSLDIIQTDGYLLEIIESSEPEVIMRALLEGIIACSYHMDQDEFNKILADTEFYTF